MRKSSVKWVTLLLLGVVLIAGISPCFGNGDPPVDPGDPYDLPPGCAPLEPTSGVLSDMAWILVTIVLQFLL